MAEHSTRNTGEGYQIRPFYLCIDVSGSMGPDEHKSPPWPIDLVNEALDALLATLRKEAEVSEVIKLALVSFAEGAKLELPLSDPDQVRVMPKLQAGGETSYLQPLLKLRELIEEDFRNRKPNAWRRPVVLFVTDGFPNRRGESAEAWQAARDTLLDPEWDPHPILVAFGFGEANEGVIKTLASGQKYTGLALIAARGQTPANQIRRIMDDLQNSMVFSVRNPAQFGINTAGYTVLTSPRTDDVG
jgi:uncharacterized protein YegL